MPAAAWAGSSQWRVLETGFGPGLNFLATWRAWKDDPQRPGLLHFHAVEPRPASPESIAHAAAASPALAAQAEELRAQWFGLTPGMHRLVFEGGRVLLTVFIGDLRDGLRQEPFYADAIFLNEVEPLWDLHTLKAVARHSRRGTSLHSASATPELRHGLAQCGFRVRQGDGQAGEPDRVAAVFDPAWEPRGQRPVHTPKPGRCVVVGAGLAGAAAASSLARRGWRVTVLDAAKAPAAGASGVPVAMIAPHFSPDDNLLSRLSRSGVRATLQEARLLLCEGVDWHATGVLEHRVGEPDGPHELPAPSLPWTRTASAGEKVAAGLTRDVHALWHEQAGWIKPAALVQAWLAQPGVAWRGNAKVERISHIGDEWRLTDVRGDELARADLVVVAAACASESLLHGKLALQPVRGQVSWGVEAGAGSLPPFAVNGDGHFIPHVPLEGGQAWFCGSTFGRGDTGLETRAGDHGANLARVRTLLPQAAAEIAPAFASGAVRAWTGVRCASADRRPLLGEVEPGLWVSTAMGSRGLTFAVLCAELLAARLHGEPLPLERRLAAAIGLARS